MVVGGAGGGKGAAEEAAATRAAAAAAAGRATRLQAFIMGPVSRFTALYFDGEISGDDDEDEGDGDSSRKGTVECFYGDGRGGAGLAGSSLAVGAGGRGGKREGCCVLDGGRRGDGGSAWHATAGLGSGGEIASRAELEVALEDTLKAVAERRAADQVNAKLFFVSDAAIL